MLLPGDLIPCGVGIIWLLGGCDVLGFWLQVSGSDVCGSCNGCFGTGVLWVYLIYGFGIDLVRVVGLGTCVFWVCLVICVGWVCRGFAKLVLGCARRCGWWVCCLVGFVICLLLGWVVVGSG